ncbi:ribonuclease T [Microbulbifer thermotolerans]|uniref:ribonuclease T n=1 Tax=Microbulbifer thermotolerans TaxID=252514 RepID=UPI002249097C|nr:ribonuclease T [Microbulbifer thermotolerans]MCX2781486.1 ribonuclease T [Microbulbifer thermotolerans]MCX2831419.1 ribonuclease T [Microbulbifer thermotolerans]
MTPAEEPTGPKSLLAQRFRGFLPVVVDLETGGFNARTDALLEVSAVILDMNEEGQLFPQETHTFHLEPFEGANIEQSALDFIGIDLESPEREAIPEEMALPEMFRKIRSAVKKHSCTRAIMVAHNAHFDLGFINAAVERCGIKRNPFHPFSCFDTATLAGLAYGQTVLAKACQVAGIEFDNSSAHSAEYDAEKTAELFCGIVNKWKALGGWPLSSATIPQGEDRETS